MFIMYNAQVPFQNLSLRKIGQSLTKLRLTKYGVFFELQCRW